MNTWSKKRTRFWLYLNTFSQPWFFLPIVFAFLNLLTASNIFQFNAYLQLKLLGWNASLSYLLLIVSNVLFLTILLVLMTRKFRFDSSYLVMIGPALNCLETLVDLFQMVYPVSITTASVLYLLRNSLISLAVFVPFCTLWSQLSRRFVDGFETTGAAFLTAICDLGPLANFWLVKELVGWSNAKPGYLRRFLGVDISFLCLEIILVFFSFSFFLSKEARRLIKIKHFLS